MNLLLVAAYSPHEPACCCNVTKVAHNEYAAGSSRFGESAAKVAVYSPHEPACCCNVTKVAHNEYAAGSSRFGESAATSSIFAARTCCCSSGFTYINLLLKQHLLLVAAYSPHEPACCCNVTKVVLNEYAAGSSRFDESANVTKVAHNEYAAGSSRFAEPAAG